ncbi:purine and uridine phosphorylase, partial [Aureobasidium melanogenum]
MSDPQQYTVGWICAIPTESIAASCFLDETHERPDYVSSNDSNDYTLGEMAGHNVVIAVLPDGEYGLTSATGVVKDMLASFPNIRVGLMVGIGGGAPTVQNDIRLGDIVVSSPQNGTGGVYQYDYGKLIQGQGLQQTGFLNQPSTLVRTTVNGLKTQYRMKGHKIDEIIRAILCDYPRLADEFSRPREDKDRLYKADFVHPVGNEGCDNCCGLLPERIVERRARIQREDNPVIHHGVIASSNSLMKDARVRDTFASEQGIMCFEMEAAGLMNHLPCLVIRGICDYSDSHKNKEWQGYAAMAAAAYAKDLLARMVPSRVQAEQKIVESLKSIEHNTIEIIETANKTAACVNDLKADAKYHRIQNWLSPPDHTTNQSEALFKRHECTGQWFVKSDVFTAFKEGKMPFIWLSGIPGCGKTILSSSIIEDLQCSSSVSSAVLLYFYFDFTEVRKQTLNNAFRSLLWQLTKRGESSFREVEKLYKSCKDGENQPSTQSLSRALESVLQAVGRVIIVLDALDECTTRRDLLQWLAETAAKELSGIQIITTSRKEYDIEVAFTKWLTKDVMLSIEQLEVDKDIQAYVHDRIRSDPGLERWRRKPFVQKEIEVKLMEKAQGMFRWAKLYEALDKLPTTLDETYARILRNLSPMYLQDTIRLLQVLTWSERPLLIEEAVDYLAVELDSECGFDEDNRLPVPKEIMRFCSSLVTVARTSEDTREYLETWSPDLFDKSQVQEEIRLAHYSVKEYFTSGRCQSDEFRFRLDLRTSATYIASASLTYLLQLQTNTPRKEIVLRFPLALYSASSWMEFARVANDEDTSLQILIERLLLVPERCAHWLSLFSPDTPLWDDPKPPLRLPQPLYYASLGGLECVANRLLESGADINSEGDKYDNALQAAAAHGLENMVNLLLQKGADVNAYRGEASTLQVASESGHVRVVQSLLAHGADVNAKGGKTGGHINALQAACFMGHLEVVELLVNSGADVNIQDGPYGSALQAASLLGCDKIVQLLLEEGADINAPEGYLCGEALDAAFDKRFGDCDFHQNRENVVLLLLEKCDGLSVQDKRITNLLRNAAGAGFENVVKRLLTADWEIIAREDRETDLNALDVCYGSALGAASYGGHENIVQMLLDRGAAAKVKGDEYGSALRTASRAGHVKIVDMLLDRGGDANVVDEDYGNSLHAASKAGHVEMVHVLLARCLEVNVYGRWYYRALQAASRAGHVEIVQTLLDRRSDVSLNDEDYGNALHAASKAGHVKTVQILLQNMIIADIGGTVNAAAFDIAFQWGYAGVFATLLERLCKETVADEHGWSSEAYLVICRGLTSRGLSQHPMRQSGCQAIPLGQTPSHFVEAVPLSGLSCSKDELEITARNMPKFAGDIQACADHPIPAGLDDFFFEVEIVHGGQSSRIAIGLCNGSSPKTVMPGWEAGSWAYHGDDGRKFGGTDKGEQYNETYGTGDTICCGVDFNSNTLAFYKNGISLGTAFEGVTGRLFPVIAIGDRDVHLRIRFHPEEFLFPLRAS